MVATAIRWEPARFEHRVFGGVSDLLARVGGERDWPAIERLDRAFEPELRLAGVRLVEAVKSKPRRRAPGVIDASTLYEVRIAEHGEIPTRAHNVHDLFNAIIWAAFPCSKLALTKALSAIQRERAAGRERMPATRTRMHDRLALVDEGGLLCVRDGARAAGTWIFGHAIYEHAYGGELDVRGAAIDVDAGTAIEGLALADARRAIDRAFATADFATAVRTGPGIPIAL